MNDTPASPDSLRIGGVPEHLNIPWYLAREHKLGARYDLNWTWTDCPGGTGAMCAMLDSGELDVAVLLAEGALAYVAKGGKARIVGTWASSPLTWGIHVRADSPFEAVEDLRGKRYGYSRLGSGSHLMALVDAEQRGWPDKDDPVLVKVGGFAGAKEAFAQDKIDAFLWEKFMTRPMVRSGDWRCIDICRAPWPAFVIAVREDKLDSHGAKLRRLMTEVNQICQALHEDEDQTQTQVIARFSLHPEDAQQWLAQMQWDCSPGVDAEALTTAGRFLHKVGTLQEVPCVDRVLATLAQSE